MEGRVSFGSQLEGEVNLPHEEATVLGTGDMASPLRNGGGRRDMLGLSSPFLFLQSRTPAHGTIQSTFRVDHPISISPV